MKEPILITYATGLQQLSDLLHRANDLNDACAQFELAKYYLKSKQNANMQKAVALLRNLAYKKYTTRQTDAQYMLGICYENGFGIPKSNQRAIQRYSAAADNVFSNDLTRNPDPVSEQAAKALTDITEGRDFDEALDEVLYGKTSPESIDCITDAAEAGDVDAQVYLMDLYNLGAKHVPVDEEEALYWAQRAAENVNVKAMELLGNACYTGRIDCLDIEKDVQRGLYWLEKAAQQGSQTAPHTLGKYCQSQKRYKEAAAWYRIYAERTIEWRNRRLGWEGAKKYKETD